MANIEITPKQFDGKNAKILVCITPQVNGRRLIDLGLQKAVEYGGETHILYVQKGQNIFMLEKTPSLLQELFDYGAEKNGIIHALCGESIADTIRSFIKKEKITHVIFGASQPELDIPSEEVADKIKYTMPHINVTVLERD